MIRHALLFQEHYTEAHRLTPRCDCGRKADIGRGVDQMAGKAGLWVCRKCNGKMGMIPNGGS